MMRLTKMLARAGVSSRRGAESLIRQGKVSVNGKVVLEPGTLVDPEQDRVNVGGKRVEFKFSPLYILLNKPRGVVTTLKDPRGRPTVRDLLKGIHRRVFPVGRLDFNTEGALILTNDGELAQRLLHPRYAVERTYRAKVKGMPSPSRLDRLREGIELEPGVWARARVRVLKVLKANSWLELTLCEGRNREVRRLCEAVGHPVLALKRVKFAEVSVEGLPPGDYRHLTPAEVHRLKALGSSRAKGPARRSFDEKPAPGEGTGGCGRTSPGSKSTGLDAGKGRKGVPARQASGGAGGCEHKGRRKSSRKRGP